ncbi:MAG: hypothetical protein LBQ54_09440 [Planctomycetaceae bacterium]|nr:hypothetical protein [Planctomycetaceae bacterium]
MPPAANARALDPSRSCRSGSQTRSRCSLESASGKISLTESDRLEEAGSKCGAACHAAARRGVAPL